MVQLRPTSPPHYPGHNSPSPALPEDVAEKESSPIPQGPVVIEGVDGGSQGFQDTVEDAAHQGSDVGPQAEVWVPNQATGHLQQSVQLLKVVAHRFHLWAKGR